MTSPIGSPPNLLFLSAEDNEKDISIYINSPGGSTTAGYAILDTMDYVKPDVRTICVGMAASMGAILLAGGAKGKRYALKNSEIMIHEPLGGVKGQAGTDMEISAKRIIKLREKIERFFHDQRASPLKNSSPTWNAITLWMRTKRRHTVLLMLFCNIRKAPGLTPAGSFDLFYKASGPFLACADVDGVFNFVYEDLAVTGFPGFQDVLRRLGHLFDRHFADDDFSTFNLSYTLLSAFDPAVKLSMPFLQAASVYIVKRNGRYPDFGQLRFQLFKVCRTGYNFHFIHLTAHTITPDKLILIRFFAVQRKIEPPNDSSSSEART